MKTITRRSHKANSQETGPRSVNSKVCDNYCRVARKNWDAFAYNTPIDTPNIHSEMLLTSVEMYCGRCRVLSTHIPFELLTRT
jgi:hypothetical protein